METGFIITIISMLLFVVLATYDGIYLHLIKYRLHVHPESKFEHMVHTARAILFPLILYFLYLSDALVFFYIGLAWVFLDILTVAVDAYAEGDSRKFMGGLPRWEYILHLFVNGFHFASIAVFLALKIQIGENQLEIVTDFESISTYPAFEWLIKNLIPGAALMGILHVALNFNQPQQTWDRLLGRFSVLRPARQKEAIK
ncbi:hypothetical protein [Negadavirga shengliensis]|uniref:Uncharacterized protein n=1 Tax=Negadavirga shengliensis TaxID=1389218 RepID=A0ABV9T7M3_9BACT